jgi:hypothetical protein
VHADEKQRMDEDIIEHEIDDEKSDEDSDDKIIKCV